MNLDASLLSHFELMDYSLLFTVAYNPNYVRKNPDMFETGDRGEYKLK